MGGHVSSVVREHVSHTPYGADQLRGELGVVYLVTQVLDVHINQIGGVIERHVPDVLHNHGSRHGLPRISHEVFEQGEFLARQIDSFACAFHTKLAVVQDQVPDLQQTSRQVWIP